MQTMFSTGNRMALCSARSVYFDLAGGEICAGNLEYAADFLREQLAEAARCESDLPRRMEDLGEWMQSNVEQVGKSYRAYLADRKTGGGRRYFSSKAHALNFLQLVAPTKLVDGAWLYGLLQHWQDSRFASLIQTYLEELGEGQPSKNHVVLYRKLLASQGCELRDDLDDEIYVQGAIQLGLAHLADRFLPEIVGFNLGYEQLPLHLLITAYELKELGIDPYYFTLHVTVDNADSGHAKQAVDAVFAAMPRLGDGEEFWRRVRNGYNLNFLGARTESVIELFDLEREMIAIFARKAIFGQYAHSDYRRVAGRTVNDWLSHPAQIAEFIRAMENEGWFRRGENPQNSRFWKLIEGEKAKMFGVFSAYEQQIIYDWIAADAVRDFARPNASRVSSQSKRELLDAQNTDENNTDFDAEINALEESLASSTGRKETVATLIAAMSPACHHSSAGLKATRIFSEIWR